MRSRVVNEQTKDKIRKAMGISVKVINIDNKKITIYPSKKEAALYLNTSNTTIGSYIRSGKLLFGKYLTYKNRLIFIKKIFTILN
jgi:hypothetical protein